MLPPNVAAEMARYNIERHRRIGVDGPWIEHLMDDEGLSYEQARELLLAWERIPINDPVLGHMATILKRNKEIHLAIFKRFRAKAQVSRKRILEHLQPLLDREIFLVTKIDKPEDARFIERLGFEDISLADDGVRCYILNEIQHPKVCHASPI
jgi:hypothetical protein